MKHELENSQVRHGAGDQLRGDEAGALCRSQGALVHAPVIDPRLAQFLDEGQSASNAQQLRDHMFSCCHTPCFHGDTITDLVKSVERAEAHAAEVLAEAV